MRDISAKDIVLMLLARSSDNKLNGITRLEKLAYLVSLSPSFRNLGDKLGFEPLHYGPYSEVVSDALEILVVNGFVEASPVSFERQSENRGDEVSIEARQGVKEYVETRNFRLTCSGGAIADYLFNSIDSSQNMEFDRIISETGGMELADLIRRVYKIAPEEMLSKSVIRSKM